MMLKKMFKIQLFFLIVGAMDVHGLPAIAEKNPAMKKVGVKQLLKLYSLNHRKLAKIGNELVERGRYEQANQFYVRAIKKKPVEPSYRMLRGKCFLKMGRWLAAVEEFQIACTVAKMVEEKNPIDLDDDVLVQLGNEMFGRQKYSEAKWCYTQAIKRNPTEMSYYTLRAQCHTEIGHSELALADFRKTLLIASNSGKDDAAVLDDTELAKVGSQLFGKEKYSDALWCYNEAIKRNDAKASHYVNRGRCYRETKEMDRAISDFEKALEMDPQNELGIISLIKALFHEHRSEDAIEKIRLLNDTQLSKLATQFDMSEQFEEAIICYSEILKRDPKTVAGLIFHKRGHCHWKLKNLEEAIADFKKSFELSPAIISTEIDLSQVFIEANRYNEAKETLEKLEHKKDMYCRNPDFCKRMQIIRMKINEWEIKRSTKPIDSKRQADKEDTIDDA